jgi:hypothetical protein
MQMLSCMMKEAKQAEFPELKLTIREQKKKISLK